MRLFQLRDNMGSAMLWPDKPYFMWLWLRYSSHGGTAATAVRSQWYNDDYTYLDAIVFGSSVVAFRGIHFKWM